MDGDNAYASKGLGLALYKAGKREEGLQHMYGAIQMKKGLNAEIFYDLFVVLLAADRKDEAKQVMEQAKTCHNYADWQERFKEALLEEPAPISPTS